jgi:hypothetical protein
VGAGGLLGAPRAGRQGEAESPTGTDAIREQLTVGRQALDEADDLLDEVE